MIKYIICVIENAIMERGAGMKKILDISKILKMTVFMLIILFCTVSVYCACSSYEKSRISKENETERAAARVITGTVRNGLDYVVNVRKTNTSSIVRLCDKYSRFLYEAIITALSIMMVFICMVLSFFGNKRIKSGSRLICYIHNKDGKKEQSTCLAV